VIYLLKLTGTKISLEKQTIKLSTVMNSLLYTIAVILVIAWAIGFFAYSVGSIIHLLLVLALIAVLLRVIRGKDAV
jgi:tryptophan-rich sensory protein